MALLKFPPPCGWWWAAKELLVGEMMSHHSTVEHRWHCCTQNGNPSQTFYFKKINYQGKIEELCLENIQDKTIGILNGCYSDAKVKRLPVPSWSRWWQRRNSRWANWKEMLRDGTNHGVKQESTLVHAARAGGVTSWSQVLWEPDSLAELWEISNKISPIAYLSQYHINEMFFCMGFKVPSQFIIL